MYYYGGAQGCCNNQPNYQTPCYYNIPYRNNNSSYAIVLVLFILLVIVLGCHFGN